MLSIVPGIARSAPKDLRRKGTDRRMLWDSARGFIINEKLFKNGENEGTHSN